MRSIVRGVVALVAAFCIINAVKAAPTIVSPTDYSKVSPFSLAFKNVIEDGSLGPDGKFATKDGKIIWSNPYFGYSDYYRTVNGVKETNPNSQRVADRILSRENSLPVTLKWGNSSGMCTVKLWRTKKDTESAPQFTVTTTENSVKFYDLEIGRNYTWTVTDSTGTATGHFYVMNESQAPRILLNDHDPNASGSDTSNTRDIGGYRTYKGSKVIKQGLIYRTAELEWCNPVDADGIRQELTYLKNTIGIKYDIDFRDHADMTSTAELGYAGSSSKWKWAWKNGSYLNLNESNIGAGVPRLNINKLTGTQFGSYTGLIPKKSGTTTANKNNRKNVWCAFTNVADSAKWPLVFHCSHGKDRAGTFALVLHGVLDIPKEIALKDFAYSWFDSPDETLNPVNMANTITNLFSYTSYSSNNDADYRFKEQCYNFLVQCGKDAGVTEANAKAKIDSFVSAMTEDAEEPDVNPALSTNRETDGDTFSYTTIYHRRNAGGGSLGSDNGSTLNYIYSSSTTTSTHAPIANLNTYNTCLCFWPVDGLPYSSPVCGYYLMGKIVTYGRYAPAGAGPYNLKAYFRSEGHSLVDRTIIEHRSGVGNYENVDLYFTPYDSSKPGEKYLNGSYVYGTSDTGTAAIEVWANATMRVRDIRDMSQKNTKAKRYKVYLKFPKGSCDNARFESLEIDGDGENLLGWFTGGEVGTRQYIKVVNSILQFNAPSKTSGVEGALGLEFSLGTANTTSSAAMLKVAGTLNINAGSTIAVDAGRKGAGTYKLVSAGTLNDNANLVFYSTVENCAKGYYGVIVRDGNNLNLVIQEGEPPDTNAEDIADADEGDWGYRVRGLGALKNETAIVFTNTAKAANWVVPSNLENVQFLVVGGGGGGGADTHASNTHGGAGGGGGGVVTGLVNFAENSVITVSVGAGGNGGITATQGGSNSKYGAAYSGKASYVFVDGSEYFWTAGGGGDNGADTSTNTTLTKGNVGNDGGSSAGSRPGQTGRGAVVASRVASVSNVKYADTSFGRQGGAGYSGTETFYNYYSAAGGGGGATTEGETASSAKAAGKGGEGLTSDITGTSRVYGSGGGGGAVAGECGALGGTGAGCGNMADVTVDNYATYLNAVANQGGGGGGGGRNIPGGNGGSGIVVLRYVDPDYSDPYVLAVPKAATGLTYTGSEITGVESGTGYTITGNKATAAGNYTAEATLEDGYTWADGTKAVKEIPWSIAKATNVWTTEPNITPASWIVGNTAGKLTTGVAKFGVVTATMNGVAFSGTLPTAVGTYTIVYTVAEDVTNYTGLTKTVSFEITEVPVINPTEYGTADSAASTYTWLGYTGPWMYTTNWTATASGTHGVPNNGTYATADFPATLANAFTCTLNESVSVKYAKFDAPNMNLVLDNATLTITDRANPSKYLAYEFGAGDNASASIEFRGASAGIVNSKSSGLARFGVEESATDKVRCTVRFIVPATGWENTAPIRATGGDSSVYFWYDTKLAIDATALGVPAENETKTVLLATATDGMYNLAKTEITCADGAKGSLAVVGTKLVLTVEADETTEPDEPQEPQLTAVDAPVAQTGLVYTGSELTGVESVAGYTLTGNTATDAGEYTALATLAEGYKWSDDTTADKSITWVIAKATNEWTTEPKISLESWTQGEAAGVLTSGVAKFGTVTASMTELPTEVGSYTITYTVAETKNYTGLNATVQFEIKAPEVVEPEEPGDDPVSQIPTIPAEWGYVKTDLGDLHNEVAVVFTNHVDKAMSWTVPADIENVQFLVVGGGGGGGGAVNATKGGAGGAGGGGGCVVTGIVNKLVKDAVVSVQVGNGGNGGTYNSSATAGNGKASHGESSLFKVGNDTYVTAFGGAGDLGYNKNSGVNNGSNSGSRYNGTTASAAVGTAATWDQTALSDKLSNVATFRNKGGNNANNKTYSSGGGGGAIEAGQAPGSSSYGGYGGKGLTSSITDVEKMYGSGGSGATAKNGGYEIISPDGAGSSYPAAKGTDGADNQGGGGGGGGYQSNGGKGGSGIVVFRYTLKSEVKVDAAEYIESKLTDKVYTGSLLMSGLTEDTAYTVSEEGGVNVGEYTVTVTLKSGFVWADGNTSSTSNFTWKITKNANEWATEPLLSVTSWAQGYAPNVKFVAPVQTIGELNATITTNGVTEAFSGTLPTEPGDYTINYSVTETDNYAGRTWGASFKIYRSEPIEGGYRVFGLGENGNEEAMVFTQSGSWNIDKNLKNVQFLVVGGGGGGGADISTSNEIQAGSGGGGGGVVTGLVNFVAGQTVAITVGAGGQGGERGGSTSPFGAVKTQAENSSFAIGTETSVVAYAGGGDTGSTVSGGNNNANTTGGQTGGNGGSSAGSRATATGRGEATCGSVNDTANAIICSNTLGNKGGAGAAQYQAGGGGGATTEGEDGTENAGGNGGEGLASSIIGTDLVYGSGGGGGAVAGGAQGPGLGGTGAGNGGQRENATSAMPNQGGGGGGGGRVGNGGNGGSGIVVFRYTLEPEWTPPMPDIDDGDVFNVNYTNDVVAALKTVSATSVDVKVNGVKLKGDDAVKALNTAVMHFDNALTFDGTAASLDIVIKVTEVNTSEPEKSKFEVTRGATEEVLEIKEDATIKTKINKFDLNSDAVIFRLVIE